MLARVLLFLLVLVTAATGPVWLFVPAALAYLFLYLGAELLLVAFLIDGYFGYAANALPWYTLTTLSSLLLLHLLRPYISVYTR